MQHIIISPKLVCFMGFLSWLKLVQKNKFLIKKVQVSYWETQVKISHAYFMTIMKSISFHIKHQLRQPNLGRTYNHYGMTEIKKLFLFVCMNHPGLKHTWLTHFTQVYSYTYQECIYGHATSIWVNISTYHPK